MPKGNLSLGGSCIKRFIIDSSSLFGPKFPLGQTVAHQSRMVHTRLHQSKCRPWTPSADTKWPKLKKETKLWEIPPKTKRQIDFKFCMLDFRHRSWAQDGSWAWRRNLTRDRSWVQVGSKTEIGPRIELGPVTKLSPRLKLGPKPMFGPGPNLGRYQSGPKTEVMPRTEVRPRIEGGPDTEVGPDTQVGSKTENFKQIFE